MPPRAMPTRAITTILCAIFLSSATLPSANSAKIRTLWTLRGGVKNYSKNKTIPVVFEHSEGNSIEDETETTTPIPTTEVLTGVLTGGQGKRKKRQLDLGEPVYHKRYLSLPKPKQALPQKVAFTQKGYLQFIRYQIAVPELTEWTMCAWIRPQNLTYDCPIFSYSHKERERSIRVVVKPARRKHVLPHVQLFVREQAIFDLALPEAETKRWFHLCSSWEAAEARWHVYVDGAVRSWGKRPEARGVRIPGGGDIVLGQEYTDFNKGLDDGLEGEMYAFNLFSTGTASMTSHAAWDPLNGDPRRRRNFISEDLEWSNLKAARSRSAGVPDRIARLFSRCVDSVRTDDDVVVSWTKTPMRVFGGAVLSNIHPVCGEF